MKHLINLPELDCMLGVATLFAIVWAIALMRAVARNINRW